MTSTRVTVGVKGSGLTLIPVAEGFGCATAVCVEIFLKVLSQSIDKSQKFNEKLIVTLAKLRTEKLLPFQLNNLINNLPTYQDFPG